jgi:cytochrome c-type biogenesis protein CcmH
MRELVRVWVWVWILAAGLAVAAPVAAQTARPMAEDPALEARVLAIAEGLRCLVCQNETIAASHADLAVDLRNQIRSQLRQGKSEREIQDYMVARYGEFVLYKPPLKPSTWLLWGGPFVLLAVVALAMARTVRQRGKPQSPGQTPALSEAHRAAARALLRPAASSTSAAVTVAGTAAPHDAPPEARP